MRLVGNALLHSTSCFVAFLLSILFGYHIFPVQKYLFCHIFPNVLYVVYHIFPKITRKSKLSHIVFAHKKRDVPEMTHLLSLQHCIAVFFL